MNISTKKNLHLVTFAIVVLGILILFLHIWSLMRYPPPSVDEAWLTSRAWAFQQTGHPYGPLDAGISDRLFTEYWLTNQWLITAIQSVVLRLTVKPGFLAMRALSLAWGGVLLVASGWSAARLFSKSVGYISVFLLALSPAFFFSAHQVRYDIMASALAYASVACYFSSNSASLSDSKTVAASSPSNRHSFAVSILGGLLLGLAIETHLNSLIFIPAIGLLLLIDFGWQFYKEPTFWGFVCGALLGACFYLVIHILPNPKSFLDQFRLYIGPTHQLPISNNVAKIIEGFSGIGNLLFFSGSSLVVLSIFAVPVLIRMKSMPAIQVLVFNAALIIAASVIIPNKETHYGILLAPGMLWLAAFFVNHFSKSIWRGRLWDYLSRAMIWAVLAAFILISPLPLTNNGGKNYQVAQDQINDHIQPGDSIIGQQVYWFGLYDHTYYSWELLFLYKDIHPDSNLEDAFAAYRPDIFIIDYPLNTLISDSFPPDSRWYYYHLPRVELFNYLKKHARLVASFPAAGYGPIQVYRIIWNNASPQP